ncbi:IRK-interacting protein-like isoform X1 [Herrania umbratica]|uniref:IRK-interacting protein-like isoform X1 n=2 Tax=Herrania umbratica TaxID=108875 RepID=A0A6J1AMQ2_9ROSI|nr:IRK-interacting protein-like isoform X1 [Herrania umbratica]
MMEAVKPSAVTPSKSKWVRTFSKVLHLHAAGAGIVPDDGVQKVPKEAGEWNDSKTTKRLSQKFDRLHDEELERRVAWEALIAKIFATISAIKAGYAQLQHAQSPYDAEGIQTADRLIVSDLKKLSELKQCFLKKQYDPSPEHSMLLAEIQEQKSLSKTFEIMGKKLESQLRLKESEIIFLRESLDESNKQNKLLEKRLNQSGQLFVLDNLHLSGLGPSHFMTVLRQTVKSIRSFVRLMIDEMKSADWDINSAANSIERAVIYWKADDKCFAFESFICREMFKAFHHPYFFLLGDSVPEGKKHPQVFFERFMELKSTKVKEYLATKPKSTFAKFCRTKYLQVVHPKMESSFFGNLSIRDMVSSYQFPDTTFFTLFAEMAKRVWLLHCLAFAFVPAASIFQISKGCRFSEVYMESVAEEAFFSSEITPQSEPRVAFTVVPGFRIGKTIIQCQVYLSQLKTR